MKTWLDPRQLQTQSPHARTALLVAASTRRWLQNRTGYTGNDGGTRHSGKLAMDESVAYVQRQFGEYLTTLRSLDPGRELGGMRVLEVGPGDTSAVAAMFIAAGAKEVISIDRFEPGRDPAHDRELSTKVYRDFDPSAFGLGEVAIDRDADPLEQITYLPSLPLETLADDSSLGPFDLIISNAVLEHVFDLEASFAAMDRLLAPEGVLVHLVDLRDHGLYSTVGHHPLTHLTVPEGLYTVISRPSGAPNRALAPTYRQLLSRAGYEYVLDVTHLLFEDGSEAPRKRYHQGSADDQLAEIRPRLNKGFKEFADEDLNAAGIAFAARRRTSV